MSQRYVIHRQVRRCTGGGVIGTVGNRFKTFCYGAMLNLSGAVFIVPAAVLIVVLPKRRSRRPR